MMMDILMYLFETYVHSDADLQVDQDQLEDELLRAGFHQKTSTRPSTGWKSWRLCNKPMHKLQLRKVHPLQCVFTRRKRLNDWISNRVVPAVS